MASAAATRVSRENASMPPLESGDRLTLREFWQRYELRPDLKKVEFIDGVVYVASPVRADQHGEPHFLVTTWLGTYAASRAGVRGIDNTTILLDGDTVLQPDVALWHDRPGRLDERGYFVGAPELVVEVAASSASIDLHDKKRVYRRNGVQEYLVWDIDTPAVHWWQLVEGDYVPISPGADGVVESVAFPGLRLPIAALIAGDFATVLAAAQPTAS
jgi:Uma2 family endonuclease